MPRITSATREGESYTVQLTSDNPDSSGKFVVGTTEVGTWKSDFANLGDGVANAEPGSQLVAVEGTQRSEPFPLAMVEP